MFKQGRSKDSLAWDKEAKKALTPQERSTGGKGPNTNGSGAGTYPKSRGTIANGYVG